MLRCYVDDNPQDWDRYAPALTYAYNTAVHRSTGTTPFDLVLSRPPPSFTNNIITGSSERSDMTFAQRLRDSIDRARSHMDKAQARYKRDFDRRVRRVTHRPKVGSHVYLDPFDGTKKRSKLQHTVEGPYKVLEIDNRTIVIQRGEVVERVSADRTTPAPQPNTAVADADKQEREASASYMASNNREGETWLVDKLIDHRKSGKGRYEFQVRWVGDYEDTWEPRANIPEELVSRYFARGARRSEAAK